MSHGIVIIGSGFAARQLVKNIRKQDANVPLTLIAADSMDEYNKPDLSLVSLSFKDGNGRGTSKCLNRLH